MIVLAIDTALGAAAACLYQTAAAEILAEEKVLLTRGHDAVLLPLIERVTSSVGFANIQRVAVTVGPGSFTGLRIGIAAAQGIGLARDIPVVGVSSLAAFAAPAIADAGEDLVAAAVDMRHGRVCLEVFAPDGRSLSEPTILTAVEAARILGNKSVRLVGSGAPILAVECWQRGIPATVMGDTLAPRIDYVARLGGLADPASAPPRPLYVKDVDVSVPTGAGV